MAVNRYLPRRYRSTVYKLKRSHGGTIFLYRQGTHTTDVKTGVKVHTGRLVTRVERAIILPVTVNRVQTQTISMISADKQFVYGGMYDQGSRHFVIDPRDLPQGYEIKRDDHIVYDGKQYEIKTIRDDEFDALWGIVGSELPGVVPQQIHELSGYDILDVQEEAS